MRFPLLLPLIAVCAFASCGNDQAYADEDYTHDDYADEDYTHDDYTHDDYADEDYSMDEGVDYGERSPAGSPSAGSAAANFGSGRGAASGGGAGAITITDATLGIPAMTVQVPKGYRAKGTLRSNPQGGAWLDFLLVADGPNRQQIVVANAVTVRDPAAVFGGQRIDLLAALQQNAVQRAKETIQRVGARVEKTSPGWKKTSSDRTSDVYATSLVLNDGREAIVVLPVLLQYFNQQRGDATSGLITLLLAPAETSESATEQLVQDGVALNQGMRENPQFAQRSHAITQNTIAGRNAQQQNFNRQMASNRAANDEFHRAQVDASRMQSESWARGQASRSETATKYSDAMSGHGRYVNPHTGEEVLIGDDIGPGGRTYIDYNGDHIQTDDPNFDPYTLPDGYRPAQNYDPDYEY